MPAKPECHGAAGSADDSAVEEDPLLAERTGVRSSHSDEPSGRADHGAEATCSGGGDALSRINPRGRPIISLMRLVGINAFMFGYGLWLASFAIAVLPRESVRFFGATRAHDFALAGYIGIAGLSQLSGPAAGVLSDRWASKFGRRRPILATAAIIEIPSLISLWACSVYKESQAAAALYFVFLFFAMLLLNIMYTAASGLIPDLVHPDQLGRANGFMAALQALGACTGLAAIYVHDNILQQYWEFILVLVVVVPCTCACSREESTPFPATTFTLRDLLKCYYIDRSSGDFFWLTLCRCLYYCGISVQFFSQDLLRDLVGLDSQESYRYASALSAIGQVCGALAAYPAGLGSDIIGRKPIVGGACLGICIIYLGFMLARNLSVFLGLGAILGTLNGCYLSVDYALAVDTLPDRAHAARWLSIWSVASVPSSFFSCSLVHDSHIRMYLCQFFVCRLCRHGNGSDLDGTTPLLHSRKFSSPAKGLRY
jgi:MFS family permease